MIRVVDGLKVWFAGRLWRAVTFSLSGVPLGIAYGLVAIGVASAAGLARAGLPAPRRWLGVRLFTSIGRLEERRLARVGGAVTSEDLAVRNVVRYLALVPLLSAIELSAAAPLLYALETLVLAIHFWLSPIIPAGPLNNPAWPLQTVPEALGASAVAFVLAWIAPWLTIGAVSAHVWLAQRVLSPSRSDQLAERVQALTTSRARALDAADLERRRIERDLHDGAQQRLVALALDLGMARRKLECSDLDAAGALVAEAHEEAKRALVEIRDLVRGIHPAVLTDRGLDAAISALAGRCPVPVEIDVRLPERLSDTLESAAYFFVAEALTNVARHSRATSARVSAAVELGRLLVEVQDDGVGAASWKVGTGLHGLADRLTAIDGRLGLRSPTGGPTVVSMEVPCAS
jgi:signal transduction histidine kinase